MLKQIVKRDGQKVDYDRERISTAIGKAAAASGSETKPDYQILLDSIEATLIASYGEDLLPTVEEIQDVVEESLMENNAPEIAKAYIIYRHKQNQRRAYRAENVEIADNIPYKKIYNILRWNMDNACESVADLNRIAESNRFPEFAAACEARYNAECRQAAERISEKGADLRLVIIAGPSASGKTTTTIKISQELEKEGLALRSINLDNYFFNLEDHPRDEFGDYDYETPQALDLDLINSHLRSLMAGETIRMPVYDFKTGQRTLNAQEMKLEKNQILLIDSLHGLHGQMTRQIPANQKFRLYIETLDQLHNERGEFMRWSDHRLLRRMIRDSWNRHLQPIETLTHWHYVRRSELQNIIPFINSVDFVLNSALPFEMPILKHLLFEFLEPALEKFKENPKRQDAYIRAKRVRNFLAPLKEYPDYSFLPRRSLLREFIGGSYYAY